MRTHSLFVILCAAMLVSSPAFAQSAGAVRVDAARGGLLGPLARPYQARSVPPVNLANSSRLDSLIRAGILYLTAQDVVALALENNIDIEVQRYSPLLAREVLRRANAGGVLRSVGLGVANGPTSVSLAGVAINTTGSPLTNIGGTGVSSGGGIVTQLGPGIPLTDPVVSLVANFQHTTAPQSNTVLTGTTALIQDLHSYQAQYSQNFVFGLSTQLTYASQRTTVNSSLFSLDPYASGYLDLQLTQNLLNGFGYPVNGRNIRVQKNNLKVTDLQFQQQVITTVSSVLNLYWDLVSFDQDMRARQREVETAERFLHDNEEQVRVGTLAEIEAVRAQAQLYAARQDLTISQTNMLQQETILKNALTRSGVGAAELKGVRVVPLDAIPVPEPGQIPSADELMPEAVAKRVELEQTRINLESNKLNLVGVKNGLRPTLQAFAELTSNGLTGELTALGAQQAGVPYLAGGYPNLLGQIFRRNYPNYSAGFALNIPLRNRAAQADYVTSLLEIRQNELNLQKLVNQVRVEVENAVVGLEQARARHDAAVQGRILSERTLNADQIKYEAGAGTSYQVVQDERDLAAAQSSEAQAMANYTHARIAFDQALGRTLEVNRISVEQAVAGKVSRASELPAQLPVPAGGPQP